MFKSLGLLASLPCPDLAGDGCPSSGAPCPFSHVPPKPTKALPASTASTPKAGVQPAAAPSKGSAVAPPAAQPPQKGQTTSVKRSLASAGIGSTPTSSVVVKKARNAYTSTSRDASSSASPSSTSSSVVTVATVRAKSSSLSKPTPSSSVASRTQAGPSTATGSRVASASYASSGSAADGWSNVPIQPPTITFKQHPSHSPISLTSRQGALKTLFAAYTQLYAPFLSSGNSVVRGIGQRLAHDHALAQELQIFKDASKITYRPSSITILVGLKKRDTAVLTDYARQAEQKAASLQQDGASDGDGSAERAVMGILETCPETGTALEIRSKRAQAEAKLKGKLTKQRLVNAGFLCPKGDLKKHGYMDEIPQEWRRDGGSKPDSVGEIKECSRCGKTFRVGGEMNEEGTERIPQDPKECRYHHGRKRFQRIPGQAGRTQVWMCCGRPVDSTALSDASCCLGPHVFKEEGPEDLNQREAFITTSELAASVAGDGSGAAAEPLDIVALDCELSYTTAGMSLTRLTLISEEGAVILDELVRTRAQVIDYNTRFSGIHADEYERDAVLDLAGVRRAMAQFVSPDTILVGHGLENDLRALRLVHTNVVDTALLFQHPRGPPYRMALRDLTSQHLGKIIQASGAHVGHSSAEDAQMALELVRFRIGSVGAEPGMEAEREDKEKGKAKGVSV
ncbi:RNA exonuclease 3 [Thecaphora frezii]